MRNYMWLGLAGLLWLLPTGSGLWAEVTLPAVFGDNMVLQQGREVTIWGWADPQEKITIDCNWRQRGWVTSGDNAGKWTIKIDPPEVGGPYKMTISGKNLIEINNILGGEVWLCSGQSNMEWPVAAAANAEREIKESNYPQIRLFTVARKAAAESQADCTGSWSVCGEQTVADFSAVGYFFGRELHEQLKVPIGLINSSWGGTPAEAWTNESWLMKLADFRPKIEQLKYNHEHLTEVQEEYQKQMDQWRQKLTELDDGLRGGGLGWAAPEYDDTGWSVITLPGVYADVGLGDFDGAVWFRKEVSVPQDWVGKELMMELGAIDDMDITWFNGIKVGGYEKPGYWQMPRKYQVPASAVKTGKNIIVVRVMDTGGVGGFTGKPGQLILTSGGGENESIGLAGAWRYKVGLDMKNQPPQPLPPMLMTNNPNAPGSLYNGMIAPLVPYGIAGVIWYQGESNAARAYQYRELFPTMICCWRQVWGRGDFPFYFVQIAPFRYGEPLIAAELREAQLMTLSLPNTGMAVTMDIGDPADIHPKNKQEVGRRLALWALAQTYRREGLVYSGPLYKEMKVEGDKIILSFTHTGGGLVARGGPLSHFVIAGEDKKFYPASATIEGETVVVHSDEVAKPAAVRYGWDNEAMPNLFNKEGLPALSFRTDDWPGVTAGRK